MKQSDIKIIKESSEWVRIDYWSYGSHGRIIMKQTLYEIKKKKIDKLLVGCRTFIRTNYKITLYDICVSALETMKKRILTLQTRLNSEYTRTFSDGENILRFKEQIRLLSLRVDRLERKLKWN